MVIVFALFALISLFVMPKISSYFSVSINSASRELASTIREAYHSAVITKRVHRLAYDLTKHEYWVESAEPGVLLDTAASLERDERRKRLFKIDENKSESAFKIEKSITRKPVPLPRGVLFDDLYTQITKDPITTGIAYTHFFPHGVSEQTLIHLEDSSEHKQSLVISPILGKTDLYERFITREEAFER